MSLIKLALRDVVTRVVVAGDGRAWSVSDARLSLFRFQNFS